MTIRKHSITAVAAVFLIVAIAPAAHAGGSVFAGVNFPTGDFNNGASTGWGLGGYFTTNLLPIVEIGGLLAYNDFSVGADNIPGFSDVFGTSFNAWEIEALGQVNLLFMRGFLGLGLANFNGIEQTSEDTAESKRKTKFAWQLGLAAKFLFLEGRLAYHQITADVSTPNWVSLTVGLTF